MLFTFSFIFALSISLSLSLSLSLFLVTSSTFSSWIVELRITFSTSSWSSSAPWRECSPYCWGSDHHAHPIVGVDTSKTGRTLFHTSPLTHNFLEKVESSVIPYFRQLSTNENSLQFWVLTIIIRNYFFSFSTHWHTKLVSMVCIVYIIFSRMYIHRLHFHNNTPLGAKLGLCRSTIYSKLGLCRSTIFSKLVQLVQISPN